MSKSIEITKVVATGDMIRYEIRDNTGLKLLKKEVTEAWVRYFNGEAFGFSPEGLPESILALPATLYLLPATWFYGVELAVPSMDRTLHEDLERIYEAYSKIYGPFKPEWRGKVMAGKIVENGMPEKRYDNVVFFSGGADAISAGINNPGKGNVLVTVPSIEGTFNGKESDYGKDFIGVKTRLVREFSQVSGSGWLMVLNNFQADIFDDRRIQSDLRFKFGLDSAAFRFDGWFGIKYIGNMLSAAPFACALGIPRLVMGSAFEPLEGRPAFNLDGANPELSDSFRFSGVSFAEQDALHARRSQKVRNILEWCAARGGKIKIWVCFDDKEEQCGECGKCVRTQLNILCCGQDPREWGFARFDEGRFSRLIRRYRYSDGACWLWDIIDSIDENVTYPYCDGMLHWLKKTGYRKYLKRARLFLPVARLLRIHRYPHYVKVISKRIL